MKSGSSSVRRRHTRLGKVQHSAPAHRLQGAAAEGTPLWAHGTASVPESMGRRPRAGVSGATGCPLCRVSQRPFSYWTHGGKQEGHTEARRPTWSLKGWNAGGSKISILPWGPRDLILQAIELANQSPSRGSHCLALGAILQCGWEMRPPWEGCLFTLTSRGALTTTSTLPMWDQWPVIILFLTALDNNVLVFDGRQIRNLTCTQSFFSYYLSNKHVFKNTQQRFLLFKSLKSNNFCNAVHYNLGQR